MNNRKLYKPAVDLGSLMHMLAAGAGTIAAHKGAVSGLTNLVRRTGTGSNYYRNAARAGLDAAVSGKDVLPKYRRALGVSAPSLTGLTDYETAKGLGTELLHKATELNKGVRPPWSSFADVQREILNNPQYRPLIETLKSQKDLSPVTSNLLGAITDAELPKSRLMEFLKRRGMGPDQQQKAFRLGGAIEAGMGALSHGPVGAVASLLGATPELLGTSLANRGNVDGLIKLKKGLIGEGAIKAMQDSGGIVDKVKRLGLNLLDPAGAEMHDLGHDLGKAVREVTHNPTAAAKSIALPPELQGMATRPEMVKALRQKHQDAVAFVKDKMLEPAKKMFGGLGKHIFTSGYNIPHETAAKVRAGLATAPMPPIDFRSAAPLRAGALPPPVSMQTMRKVASGFNVKIPEHIKKIYIEKLKQATDPKDIARNRLTEKLKHFGKGGLKGGVLGGVAGGVYGALTPDKNDTHEDMNDARIDSALRKGLIGMGLGAGAGLGVTGVRYGKHKQRINSKADAITAHRAMPNLQEDMLLATVMERVKGKNQADRTKALKLWEARAKAIAEGNTAVEPYSKLTGHPTLANYAKLKKNLHESRLAFLDENPPDGNHLTGVTDHPEGVKKLREGYRRMRRRERDFKNYHKESFKDDAKYIEESKAHADKYMPKALERAEQDAALDDLENRTSMLTEEMKSVLPQGAQALIDKLNRARRAQFFDS